MAAKHPIDSAESLLRGIIDTRLGVRENLPIEELVGAIRDFWAIEFDVRQSDDSDGFLFQYGRASWLELPTFVCGFTRQFEIFEGDEHECYSQVSVEYQYPLGDDLRAVGGRETWWFYRSGVPFDEWLRDILLDSIWLELRGREIGGVTVSQGIV